MDNQNFFPGSRGNRIIALGLRLENIVVRELILVSSRVRPFICHGLTRGQSLKMNLHSGVMRA